MYQNYLSTALRGLIKNKLFSVINIGGLAIGLAVVLLIALYVSSELTYDKFWTDADHLYRAETSFVVPGRKLTSRATSPGPLAATMAREFAGRITASTRLFDMITTISLDDRQFGERIAMVDANFFDLFDVTVTKGNREGVLANNTSIMINESLSIKYFGEKEAVGQTLKLNGAPYKVVAVMQNLPTNTHLNFEMIALFDPLRFIGQPWVARQWVSASTYTYFKLNPLIDIDEISAGFPTMLDRNVTMRVPGSESFQPSNIFKFDLVAVPDIHLYSTKPKNFKQPGNINIVLSFVGIAFLVLLIAGINFTNLSTARATMRAREIAIRKMAGAKRWQLIFQFLGESLFQTLLALILAAIIIQITLPFYNELLGKNLTLEIGTDPYKALFIFFTIVSVSLLSSLYPALVLSSIRPIKALHDSTPSAQGSAFLQNNLVVMQFAISIALIISTGIIYGQSRYASTMDLGFETENRLMVRGVNGQSLLPFYETLKREMLSIPGVVDVTFASDTLPMENNKNSLVSVLGHETASKVLMEHSAIDFDFFKGFGVHPLAGRLFSESRRADMYQASKTIGAPGTLGIVINESAVSKLGFSNAENALNNVVLAKLGNPGISDNVMGKIIGVIPDIVLRSAHTEVTPMIFYVWEGTLGPMFLKLLPTHQGETVKAVDEIWAKILPNTPIKRSFISDRINVLYRSETRQAQMFFYFSLFAVFVASLGLYGLASFKVERHTKEIGLRKVMGASVFEIVHLLTKKFTKPVMIANLLAWPIASYFMLNWLQGFSQRLENKAIVLIFLGAGLTVLLIAWVTVSGHVFRAARRKPVKTLRHE